MQRLIGGVATLLALAGALSSAEPNGDWKLDVVRLKTGVVLKGLVVDETKTEVIFKNVRPRRTGYPTVVIDITLPKSEVDRLDKLAGKERDDLKARILALDQRDTEQRLKELELRPAYWAESRKEGLSYASEHFLLIANASDSIARRAAYRLEQIYGAYATYLPPVRRPAKPNTTTTILLVQSIADYQAMLKAQGRDIFNPAFYDAGRNEVVCASELTQLGEQLEKIRREHEQLWERIRMQSAEAVKLPKGEVRDRALEQIKQARDNIMKASAKNEELFNVATRQLFQTLCHEAFHAYLANFVYPAEQFTVPRWLNEGLAQVFETALLETGELRLGHVPEVRLNRVKELLDKGELVPLADLLKSTPQQFIVAGPDRRAADRHYLTAWALAHYLTFDRKLLGTKALDTYMQAVSREGNPTAAFVELVDKKPLEEIEKAFHEYVKSLRVDGKAEGK